MKLVYLCFQTTVDGTAAASHVFGIVRGLRRLGWSVELIGVKYSESVEKPSVLKRVMEMTRASLRGLLSIPGSTVVYVRTHFVAVPVAFFARVLKKTVIQELNGPYSDVFIAWPVFRHVAWLVQAMMRTQLRWADAVVTVTPQLKSWVQSETGRRQVFVVPNGADVTLFRPTEAESQHLPPEYVFFFGALAKWQGVDVLIDATRNSKWPKGLFLVIAGDGAQRQQVEHASRVNPRVVYLGKVKHDALPEMISGSIAVAVPKNDMGDRRATGLSPIKLYEALACGVPVIVSDLPGLSDMVRENGCGLVFPHNDGEALVDAIVKMYSSPSLRAGMGARGRAAVVANHSWEARASETDRILRMIVRQG